MSTVCPTSTGGNPHITKAYAISSPEDATRVYDAWAASFDADMRSDTVEYVAPVHVADAVMRHLPNAKPLQVLDAGCGTGLGGIALASKLQSSTPASNATFTIDGVDISTGMLNVAARSRVYRSLQPANLNQPLSSVGVSEATFDVIICIGTLTHGHVGPGVLDEFARATKPNGVIVATVLEDIWESGGFRAEVDRLVQRQSVHVVEQEVQDYRKGAGVKARILVLRKNG